ncbi:MAG: glycosyltransferase family 2 protein [Candidatus Amesbacteria bacterium]|nr:glycosyltransferase family 2 protein [Candidatus Amesbacteria bacterium]
MKKLLKNKLTIVTVNYNSVEFTKALVNSIHKSKVDFGIKIIVVENSKEDLSNISGIIYLKNKGNLGFSHGNNLGLTKAEGKYVWFLNPDTTVDPDKISYRIRYMDTHPDVGMATPKLILPNGLLDKNCRRQFPTLGNSLKHFLKIGNGYYIGGDIDVETEVDVVMGSCLLVRRELGDKINWWDEDYFMYGEDIEFCWQIKNLGYKIMYVPQVTVHHHHGASSGLKKTSQKLTTANRETKIRSIKATIGAMRIFYKKHYEKENIFITNWLVYVGMWVLEKVRLITLSA